MVLLLTISIGSILHYFLRNPEWMEKLSENLRTEFRDIDSISMAALQDNKLSNVTIKESLRMYPPLPGGFPRIVPEPGVDLKGFRLPLGTRVAIYQQATYRSDASPMSSDRNAEWATKSSKTIDLTLMNRSVLACEHVRACASR